MTQPSPISRARPGDPTGPGQIVSADTPEGCRIEKFLVPSPSMGRDIRAGVVLPPAYQLEPSCRFPVLYALHGMDAPWVTWSEMPTLRAALRDKPMLVVFFDGDAAGWYVDSTIRPDSQFATFFFNELLPEIERRYRTDGRRCTTGFSMGGYGAMQYMLTKPEMFVSASSLSSSLNYMESPNKEVGKSVARVLGPLPQHAADYARYGIRNRVEACTQNGTALPPIYLACGTEDRSITKCRAFRDYLKAKGVRCEYSESPGKHDWSYWKAQAPAMIDFHWRTLGG